MKNSNAKNEKNIVILTKKIAKTNEMTIIQIIRTSILHLFFIRYMISIIRQIIARIKTLSAIIINVNERIIKSKIAFDLKSRNTTNEKEKKKDKRRKINNNNNNEFSFTFSTYVDHIYIDIINLNTIDIVVNEVYSFYVVIIVWILKFDVTHHCSSNRNLFFKQFKKINDWINITCEEIFRIESINNIIILLSNENFLQLIDIMYIFSFTINLINTSKLHQRKSNIFYSKNEFVCLYEFNDDFVINVDMINNLFALRTINNTINIIDQITKSITFNITANFISIVSIKNYTYSYLRNLFLISIFDILVLHISIIKT